jgi:hypothetical protein
MNSHLILQGCFSLGPVEFSNARIRSLSPQRNDPAGLICCLVPTNGDGERLAIVGSIIRNGSDMALHLLCDNTRANKVTWGPVDIVIRWF